MVSDVWNSTPAHGSPIERWQAKIRRLHQYLRGWTKSESGAYKKEKTAILNKLDDLDRKAELAALTEFELNLKHVLNERLAELLREEELKWYQRAKVKHLLEGDVNTKYFHLLANGRHRKTRIFQLEDGNNIISGDAQLKEHITTYYKNLFGSSTKSNIMLDERSRLPPPTSRLPHQPPAGVHSEPDGHPIGVRASLPDVRSQFCSFTGGSTRLARALKDGALVRWEPEFVFLGGLPALLPRCSAVFIRRVLCWVFSGRSRRTCGYGRQSDSCGGRRPSGQWFFCGSCGGLRPPADVL